MSSAQRKPMKILGLLTGFTVEAVIEGELRGLGPIEEVFDLPETIAQVQVTKYPRIEDLSAQLQTFRPNIVYLHGGIFADRSNIQNQALSPLAFTQTETGRSHFSSLFSNVGVDLVYLDASATMATAELIHSQGVPYVIAWPGEHPPYSLPSMHFAHAFFSCLRKSIVTIPEAFAIAMHVTRAFLSRLNGQGEVTTPSLPRLLCAAPPTLPNSSSVPPYTSNVDSGDSSKPLHEINPEYAQLRMCAPHAELRMMVAGLQDLMNAHCLGHLCESLRALLVAEVRSLKLIKASPCSAPPQYLPSGADAVRCQVSTASGVQFCVVLGGPPEILGNLGLVEHGLRQTITADAQALQIKLPPADSSLPEVQSSPYLGKGAPGMELLAITSTWVVQVLKFMAQSAHDRTLVTAGISAVSNSATAAFTIQDANRYISVATGNNPAKFQPKGRLGANVNAAARVLAAQRAAAAAVAVQQLAAANAARASPANIAATPAIQGQAPRPPSAVVTLPLPAVAVPPPAVAAPTPSASGWKSDRPSLDKCTEQQFIKDLAAFLTKTKGRAVDIDAFPEATLNGVRLDAFALYREVCRRGGYAAANRIDWKGRVFSAMKNYNEKAAMTGIGNILKHHYQTLLLEYEKENSRDVQKNGCILCGQALPGNEAGTCAACCKAAANGGGPVM